MKYLRASLVSARPETMKAFEYESPVYLSQVHFPELPAIFWASDILPTEQLIGQLRARQWHTTDIGDALDEARACLKAEG